jgi:phosphoglucosamine mutase
LDPDRPPRRPTGFGVGHLDADPTAADAYRHYLCDALDGRRLDGLSVVVDCAHGAASEIAPPVLEALGARVTAIGCGPNGTNINDGCGSTRPEALAAAVLEHGADIGLALDGDADRLVAVDGRGTVVDGDTLLAMFALDLAERGKLAGNTVVITVMTNLGFRLAMTERQIMVRETPVGDRHVLAALDAEGLSLGGEQSGHIVFRRSATTGDGILTGLFLADLVLRAGSTLAEMASGLLETVPQVLLNVSVEGPGRVAEAAEVWREVALIESELGTTGRVVLRPSGTEPLVRVMVEAATPAQAEEAARRISVAVEQALGAATAP